MPRSRCVVSGFVLLLVTWLSATGIYHLFGQKLELMVFKRSFKVHNSTTPLTVNFPSNYHATGRLFLPHSDIVEPFEIWFTKDFNRSRIDYYYGTDKTYQRADLGKYGVTFKVVPMHTEKDGNYIGCWNLEGHKGWPIIPQPIVPNMSYFKYAGEEVYMGTPASRWEYRYMVYGLLNAHTLLVSKLDPIRPVRYEMKGYDSLMASYYDKYVLEYISFEEWKPDLEKFELPKDQWCYNWSHSLDSHFISNPMGEFMSHGEDIVEEMYSMYKRHHGKIYSSKHEHVKRKHIFRHNMRYIRSINRQNLNYKLAPNHLVDLTDEEYDGHADLSDDNSTNHEGGVHLEEQHEAYSNMSTVLKTIDVPDELDWRDYGAVTAVRGQGICGSCYALGAVGAVEGAYFMKTGRLLELSAQQIIDCSWGSGNHGCRGGWYNKALSWIYLNGVAEAKNYGPYLAQEGTCETLRIKERIKIDAFAFVPKYNNSALKRAIAKYGPACVSINQRPLSLKFYSWGVYDNPECDNSSTRHTVLVVGYGKEKGVPYWLIKNSWSTSWGVDGYIKLAWRDNICGVTKNPVVALFKDISFQFPVKEKIDYVNPLDPTSLGRKVHAQHRPSFHGNINASRFHGNAQKSSVDISTVQNSEEIIRRKFKHKIASSNSLRGKQKEEKIAGDKTAVHFKLPELKAENVVENPLKTFAPPQKHTNKVTKQMEMADKDDLVKPFNSQMNENENSDDKTSQSSNTERNDIETQNKAEDADKMVEVTNSKTPEYFQKGLMIKGSSEPSVTDIYGAGRDLASNSQVTDDIRPHRNFIYSSSEKAQNPEIWNMKSETIDPEYYYRSYPYNLYQTYAEEYGTQIGTERLSRPYDEYFAEGNDLNRWLPNGKTAELEATRPFVIKNKEDNPLGRLPKQKNRLKVTEKDSAPSASNVALTKAIGLKTEAKVKTSPLTRSRNRKSPKTAKYLRHYAGKLQDIYDKLEKVIAASQKKKRPIRKNHILKGY
ncbi:uncharacterized protein [Montipora foliosa]|uniref:uncharacterized protein n=1 Tax=Montipora foliosa TaxID=591990 RepID=UPI0035F165C2